ncbi:nucleoside deaminase [Legionella pneumophila]|uniref:nucleoside deaminase n=1 Tax=Legionella pneumophila TaxID=446 RepID=UPI001A2A5575|nr:nucleoside deaminase [Legionella pneumophila]MCZ4736341.1 nucleoside deaminase [Legionella pneumophila]HAU1284706.1 nucleoside deaminase [Legionella pneumophila]HEC5056216.1 nucleoside deaminase [Legionella pneumophila]
MDKYIYDFMAATIEVAATNPMAPYGAIIVYDDKEILLKSVNSAHNNPLMHGELSVIHRLFDDGFDGDVSKLSLYTTAEPCPMCAAAIYWAMIPKVVYGSSISFLHELFGRQIQLGVKEILSKTPNFYECQLLGGVMEKNCNQLFIEAKKLREL